MLFIEAWSGAKSWYAARQEKADLAARMAERDIEEALNALRSAVDTIKSDKAPPADHPVEG
jgi:hypothetical protein